MVHSRGLEWHYCEGLMRSVMYISKCSRPPPPPLLSPPKPCPLETWARNPALRKTQMLEVFSKIFFLHPSFCLLAWHGTNAFTGNWDFNPCQETAYPRSLGNTCSSKSSTSTHLLFQHPGFQRHLQIDA